jgi:hypothetical protein
LRTPSFPGADAKWPRIFLAGVIMPLAVMPGIAPSATFAQRGGLTMSTDVSELCPLIHSRTPHTVRMSVGPGGIICWIDHDVYQKTCIELDWTLDQLRELVAACEAEAAHTDL